eukprot:272024_1
MSPDAEESDVVQTNHNMHDENSVVNLDPDVEKILEMGLDAGGTYLYSNQELISSFLKGLFAEESISKSHCVDWVRCILSGGNGTDSFLTNLSKLTGARSRCAEKWSGNHTAFRCKQCNMSESSCICVECFKNSNHADHEFFVYRSSLGGCCDCGDENAWKAHGFCSNHNGKMDLALPEEYQMITKLVFSALIGILVSSLESSDTCETTIQSITELLQDLSNSNDAVRHSITREIVESSMREHPMSFSRSSSEFLMNTENDSKIDTEVADNGVLSIPADLLEVRPEPQNYTEDLVVADLTVSERIEEILTTFFLEMMFDPEFKSKFADAFVRYYPTYVEQLFQKTWICKSLDKVTVQMFTIESLSLKMIQDNFLLEMMISCLKRIFTKGSIRKTPDSALILNADGDVITKHLYWQLTHDLAFVAAHKKCAQIFIQKDTVVFAFLELFKFLHHLQPLIRIPDGEPHVLHESSTWEKCFSLDLEMLMIFDYLICAVSSPNNSNKQGNRHISKDRCRWVAEQLVRFVDEMIVRDEINLNMPTRWQYSLKLVEFDVLSQELSIHCPFHRLLARTVIEGVSKLQMDPTEFLRCSPDFILKLVEAPLRCIVFELQVRMEKWKRNGRKAWGSAFVYKRSFWHDYSMDLDYILLQLCSLALPEVCLDHFVETCVRRFDMTHCFTIISKGQGGNNQVKLCQADCLAASEFLAFLLSLSSIHNRLWSSDEQMIRRELIHRLVVSDSSFSGLSEKICSRLVKHSKFEALIHEVADYKGPSHMQQGIFSLKPSLWNEFDEGFIHFAPAEKSQAQLRFSHLRKKPKKKDILSLTPEIATRVTRLLRSRAVHGILFSVLYNALRSVSVPSEPSSPSKSTLPSGAMQYVQLLKQVLSIISILVHVGVNDSDGSDTESQQPISEDLSRVDFIDVALAFPSSDFVSNSSVEVLPTSNEGPPTSIRGLLVSLSEHPELVDDVQTVFDILDLLQSRSRSQSSSGQDAHLELSPLPLPPMNRSPDLHPSSPVMMRQRKLKIAKDHQDKLLKKFARRQKAAQENWDNFRLDGTDSKMVDESEDQDDMSCVVCFQNHSTESPMGKIAYLYRTARIRYTHI